MKTAKQLINEINAAKLDGVRFVEDEINLDGAVEVATIDREEHRWFVVATVVFKTGDEFFGVCGVISLKSESMDYESCCVVCEAFEMAEVASVTYTAKK